MKFNEFDKAVKGLVVESTQQNLVRIAHVEDLIYDNGHDGAVEAINYLNDVRRMLEKGAGEKPVTLTVKWDGSPALVVGTDPEDGRFFIGTESVFAKGEPKRIKKPADISKFYAEHSQDLREKLLAAFKYLKKLGITGVLRGDLLFTPDSKVEDTIDGERVITFTPNTVTYAVPVKSEVGQAIAKAKIGIAFNHTYHGTSLDSMKKMPGANLQGLNDTPDVWVDDSSYKDMTGRASLTPKENEDLIVAIDKVRNTLQKLTKAKFNAVIQNKDFARFIKNYINKQVDQGVQVGNPIEFLKGYIEFYKEKIGATAPQDTVKNPQTLKNRLYKAKQLEKFVEDNMNTMLGILAIYQQLIDLKMRLMSKLNMIDSHVSTFKKDAGGYSIMAPEGFVVIGHYGNAVKLVDRLEFSRMNRARWAAKK